ncbi:MAG: DUF202 domain-containing protein [Marinibacterium sp.]|nr:DUF202 domain-containing protein [Marinibacterium sp.]
MSEQSSSDLAIRRAEDTVMLAVIRSDLANQRTLLAHVKTALGMSVAGLGFLKFAGQDPVLSLLGVIALPVSVGVLGLGVASFLLTRRRIRAEARDAGL